MRSLAEYLLAQGLVNRSQLEEAVQNQVLLGANLGTQLMELGAIDEQGLLEASGKFFGLRYLCAQDISIDYETLRLLSPSEVDDLDLIPYRADSHSVQVLCVEPSNVVALDYVQAKLQRRVQPILISEPRYWQLLQRFYAIERGFNVVVGLDPRFVHEPPAAAPAAPNLAQDLMSEDAFEQIYQRSVDDEIEQDAPAAAAHPLAQTYELKHAPAVVQAAAHSQIQSPSVTDELPVLTGTECPEPPAAQTQTMVMPVLQNQAAIPQPAPPPAPETERAPLFVAASELLGVAMPPLRKAPRPAADAQISPPQGDAPRLEQEPLLLEEIVEPAAASEAPPVSAAVLSTSKVGAAASGQLAPATLEQGPMTFGQAAVALESATDREQIGLTVLRYAKSQFLRAMLFTVHKDQLLAWREIGLGPLAHPFGRFHMPLDDDSVFRTVVENRAHFLGALKKTPSNIQFLAAMGKQVPRSAVVLPVLARGRVVNVLYADAGHKQHCANDIGELLILALKIGQSYEAMIHQRLAQALRG